MAVIALGAQAAAPTTILRAEIAVATNGREVRGSWIRSTPSIDLTARVPMN